MKVLVTGSAGFIGFHLTKKLLERGDVVLGIDNLNPYYDVTLKKDRLLELQKAAKKYSTSFQFSEINLEDSENINSFFDENKPQKVINLAAQAGVRYSLENPSAYIQSNLVGFGNILENCRNHDVEHLVYASSSSVYGGNTNFPFSEKDGVNHPVSLYAATKRSNELMAHTYSHLFNLPSTAVRFFTVYGPWGRPDMALFLFTKAILNNQPIKIFNQGDMIRDFTYVDDIVNSLIKLLDKVATPLKNFDSSNPDPSTSWCPHRIFNIGNSKPTNLMKYIDCLENSLNRKAIKFFLPMQKGDVRVTSSNCSALEDWIGYKPSTEIETGISKFVKWFREYYKI